MDERDRRARVAGESTRSGTPRRESIREDDEPSALEKQAKARVGGRVDAKRIPEEGVEPSTLGRRPSILTDGPLGHARANTMRKHREGPGGIRTHVIPINSRELDHSATDPMHSLAFARIERAATFSRGFARLGRFEDVQGIEQPVHDKHQTPTLPM